MLRSKACRSLPTLYMIRPGPPATVTWHSWYNDTSGTQLIPRKHVDTLFSYQARCVTQCSWQTACTRRRLHLQSTAQCLPPDHDLQDVRQTPLTRHLDKLTWQQPIDRRILLSNVAASVLAVAAAERPAAASVTLTIKATSQPKEYVLKAGYRITVPDSWALAYDRSSSTELGTQVFFGNFKTYETLSIFKLQRPEAEQGTDLDPDQLLTTVLTEQRDNLSTFNFELLSGPTPTARTTESVEGTQPEATTYYDSEYTMAVCRGLIQEGSGGRRRCVGPRDTDLQIVSRHFFQTFAFGPNDKYIYVVRGSTPSEQWSQVGPAVMQAVQSFRLA